MFFFVFDDYKLGFVAFDDKLGSDPITIDLLLTGGDDGFDVSNLS